MASPSAVLPWTLPVVLGNPVAPTGATITSVGGTPTVTKIAAIGPGWATVTATPGTPSVTAPNSISLTSATVTATSGTLTVSQVVAPVQKPLPWVLPIILGGASDIYPPTAHVAAVGGTAVILGHGFPYVFPFAFPTSPFDVSAIPASITTTTGTATVTGAASATTPIGATIFAQPGTPLVTGPTTRTVNPGGANIVTAPGTPRVQTVRIATTVFVVDGSQKLIDWTTGAAAPLPDNPLIGTTLPALLNSTTCTVQPISYPNTFPIADALNVGANNLAVAIANCVGQFILVGYSQGAAICSMALEQMQNGGLVNQAPNCVGAVMFGNPARQMGAIAPVQSDPGGHGIWSANLVTATPAYWYEFALPGDIVADVPNSAYGQSIQSIFNVLLNQYLGTGNFVQFVLNNLTNGVQITSSQLGQLVLLLAYLNGTIPTPSGQLGFAAHGGYHNTAPPGATLTCAQLAANYINSVTQSGSVVTFRNVQPGAANIATAAGAPFVAAVISPSSATLAATGGTPLVNQPITITPSGATITTTVGLPNAATSVLPWQLPVILTATTTIFVTPNSAVIATSLGTPIVTTPELLTPSANTITTTMGAPIVTAPDTVTPSANTITTTMGTPTVTAPDTATLSGDTIATSMGTLTLTTPQTLTPSSATITATTGTPNLIIIAVVHFVPQPSMPIAVSRAATF